MDIKSVKIEEKLPKSVEEARTIFKKMTERNPLVRKLHIQFDLGAPDTEDEDLI